MERPAGRPAGATPGAMEAAADIAADMFGVSRLRREELRSLFRARRWNCGRVDIFSPQRTRGARSREPFISTHALCFMTFYQNP